MLACRLWLLILITALPFSQVRASECADKLRGDEIRIAPEFVQEGGVEIPVFSDVHGNLEGLFRAVGEMQVKRQRRFPLVLVTGDFGFFPFPEQLTPEVRRHE